MNLPDNISEKERAIAEVYRAFDVSTEAMELRKQLDQGLINKVEFAESILYHWQVFASQPQHAHLFKE